MRRYLAVLSASLLLFSLAGPRATLASVISGPNTVLVGTTLETYYIITGASGATYDLLQKSSWTNDQAEAQALGTNLITITSATHNAAVLNDVAQDFSASISGLNLAAVPLWIGLNDQSHDPAFGGTDDGAGGASSTHAGNFVWADGSSPTYRNWNAGTGEPSNWTPGEYYAALNWQYANNQGSLGTWNDTPNNGTEGDNGYYGIAVAAPEPASLLVAALGGLCLMLRRPWRR